MGKVIKIEAALDRRLSFVPAFKTFSFEFKKCLVKALSLIECGMPPKQAAAESSFEKVWIKEGHGKARKKRG